MASRDFYFVYDLDRSTMVASRVCKHEDYTFYLYDWKKMKWVEYPQLVRIFAGEDWDYIEVSEKEVYRIIDSTLNSR